MHAVCKRNPMGTVPPAGIIKGRKLGGFLAKQVKLE